jgi:hypothetical protein
MGNAAEERRKFEATVGIILGLVMVVGGFILISQGAKENRDFNRWQAALLVQETAELQAIGDGSDVVMAGSIDLKNPVSEGFVIYNYWEQRRDSLEHGRLSWERVSAQDYRPAFQLLLGDQEVMVHSWRAVLYNTQEGLQSFNVKLEGFTLGERVAVFGTVVSPDAPFEVQANVICGGGREECLEGLSAGPTILPKIAAILILLGGGSIWLGVRGRRTPPRTPPNELAA